jgi:hypothetical protein
VDAKPHVQDDSAAESFCVQGARVLKPATQFRKALNTGLALVRNPEDHGTHDPAAHEENADMEARVAEVTAEPSVVAALFVVVAVGVES